MERAQGHAPKQKVAAEQVVEEVKLASSTPAVNQQAVSDLDQLLAEIDGVLEENAEDFVKGFVQKGGQ